MAAGASAMLLLALLQNCISKFPERFNSCMEEVANLFRELHNFFPISSGGTFQLAFL